MYFDEYLQNELCRRARIESIGMNRYITWVKLLYKKPKCYFILGKEEELGIFKEVIA